MGTELSRRRNGVSTRLAFEHDMNVERQLRKIDQRATDERAQGRHDVADYVDGLKTVYQRDVDAGRPEPWSHYEPMIDEEFGDRTARRRIAFDPGGRSISPPTMDWDPVMQSIQDTGGYTIGDAGEAPTSGYMISLPGTEERRPTETVTPATEADYHKRHWDRMAEDPDIDQGGWDSKGTFYTDLSRNDQDLYRTIGDAVTTDQESIYDLNMDQVLDTMDNPETTADDYNPLLVGPGTIARRVAMPMLYRGIDREFDPSYVSKENAGYSYWTDNSELAKQYGDHVYQYDLPDEAMGQSYIDDDGERPLYYDNDGKAGLNGVAGREYLVYNDHEDYDPSKITRAAWVGDPPPPPPTTLPSDHARPGYDPDAEVHREYDPDHAFVWDMRPEVPLRMPDEFAIEDENRAIARERAMRQLFPDHDFAYDTSGLDGGQALKVGGMAFFAAMGQYERALSFTADMDPERRKQLIKRREHEYPHLPGESFGEYGPQEAPAKQRKMTPEQRRKLRKQQNPKRDALDPNALDDRIDMATLVKNALSRYHGATPEQLTQGKDWYAQARRQLQAIAQQTGGDFSKAAGIMAALSPQLSWETNLNAGTHFLNAYDPTQRHKWRMPNVTPQALAQWNEVSGGRPPSTPEEFAAVANLAGISDPEWAKEMAMPGAWDRAAKAPAPASKPYTGTGMPALGDNVLRAMNVYDSDDPRKVLDYTSSPKVHSFWRNFLGDESFVTIDKHMLRALDRGFGQDPLMSYGKSTNDGERKSPEDLRVNMLEKMLGYGQSQKGDEQVSVPTGYNSYAEAIRQATAQVNQGKDPSEHITPAQMQAIIWVQHKGDMDAFAKRKSQEEWEAKNPGRTKPAPKPYTPALPKQPIPEYTQSDEWAEANPYAGGEARPKRVVGPVGPTMAPDNIVDVDVTPEPVPFVTPPKYEPKAASFDPRDEYKNLGDNMQADVDKYGLDETPHTASLDRFWLGALIEAT